MDILITGAAGFVGKNLTAALELRYGNQANSAGLQKGGGIVLQMTPGMMFDYMGILMDKEAPQIIK